jgi:hypothetical protein
MMPRKIKMMKMMSMIVKIECNQIFGNERDYWKFIDDAEY